MAVQVWHVLPDFGDPPPVERLREYVHRALAGTLDVAGRLGGPANSGGRRGRTASPTRVG